MGEKKPIFVTKPYLPPFDEFVEGLKEIWGTSILTNMGPFHKRLSESLQKYLKVDEIALIVNGHLALEIGIKALGLQGEVITTPFTFASTTHALVRNGLTPVFCDIHIQNYNMDTPFIESLISEKTCAILPVHVYGTPCDVDAIEKIAKKYNLKVLYDAAHAFGVQIGERGIGSYGDMSMFSFHATKVFNTIEGGALTFSNQQLGRSIYLLKNFGIAGPEEIVLAGTNAKMNEIQALMGTINLKYIENEITKRKSKVDLYQKYLSVIPGVTLLAQPPKEVKANYAYFPILIDETKYGIDRDSLCRILESNKIFPRKYFFPLVPNFSCFQKTYARKYALPVANYVADRILTLPLWGEIPNSVIEEICAIISNAESN